MTDNSSLTQVVQFGVESTGAQGTLVAATKRMQTLMIDWSPKPQVDMFRPSGNKWSTVAAFNREWSEGKISGKPSFGELPYVLCSILNSTTPTAQGLNGAQKWVWTPGSTTADTIQTYSIESGNAFRARQYPFSYIQQLGLKFTREAVDLSGSVMAQALTDGTTLTPLTGSNDVQTGTMSGSPTGGTFTLKFLGSVTSGIAYNATGATAQTAFTALATVGAGNATITGSAGGPYVITFVGNLANNFQPLVIADSTSLTGGSTPTLTIVHTTPGVAVNPEPAINPVIPPQINFWLDLSSANLGTTKLTKSFSVDWGVDNRQAQVWALNQAQSGFSGLVEVEPKPTAKVLLEVDAAGMALLPYLRNGTTVFTRIEALGPTIDGTATYRLRIDQALKLQNIGAFSDHNGVYAIEFDGQFVFDSAWGKSVTVELINLLPSLT